MTDQNYESTYTSGSTNNVGLADTNETTRGIKDNLTNAKEKITGQAVGIKDKLSEQTRTYGNQLVQKIDSARGRTSERLRNTSNRIQSLAMYVEEHDARDMSEAALANSRELIRKHPGKSLLVGMVLGVLVGRLFSMGSDIRRRY